MSSVGSHREAGQALTDTLWAAVAPLGGASVTSMAGDLAGTFQLIALVTGEADHRPNCKACLRAHRASAIHHLPRIGTLLDCGGQSRTNMSLALELEMVQCKGKDGKEDKRLLGEV